MGACHEKYLSGLLPHSVLAVCLDDCLAEPPHNENALSVPRIEIPFRCRTWTGLSLPSAQHRTRRWSYFGLKGIWAFHLCLLRETLLLAGPRLRRRRRPPPHAFSSVSPVGADCSSHWSVICPGRDRIKPGEDKKNQNTNGRKREIKPRSKQLVSSKQLYATLTCASESESALKVREVTSLYSFSSLGCRPALPCYDLEELSSS